MVVDKVPNLGSTGLQAPSVRLNNPDGSLYGLPAGKVGFSFAPFAKKRFDPLSLPPGYKAALWRPFLFGGYWQPFGAPHVLRL